MKMPTLALAATVLLAGCDSLQPDRSALLATSERPDVRPRCDACHGFAPRTGAHRYHMDTTRTVSLGRHMTCYDCHSASIEIHRTPMLDSIYYGDGSTQPFRLFTEKCG